MALFTGAFFVAQVSLIIVAKPFYAIFRKACEAFEKFRQNIAFCRNDRYAERYSRKTVRGS